MKHDSMNDKREKIDAYVSMLIKMNEHMNLTGARTKERITSELITPALGFIPYLHGKSIADIGSGNGIPGVIIKIVRPDLSVVLIESRKKRAAFLREISYALLLDMTIIEERAEKVSNMKFDTVVGFRVAKLDLFLALARPLLAENGIVVQHSPEMPSGNSVRTVDKHKGIWYYDKGDDDFIVARPMFHMKHC